MSNPTSIFDELAFKAACYDAIAAGPDDFFCVFDSSGVLLDSYGENILRDGVSGVAGKPQCLNDFIFSDDLETAQIAINNTQGQGGTTKVVVRLITPTGAFFSKLRANRVYYDGHVYVHVHFTDLSKGFHEFGSSSILDNVPAGIFVKGPDLKFEYVNNAFLSLINALDRSRIIGYEDDTFLDIESARISRKADSDLFARDVVETRQRFEVGIGNKEKRVLTMGKRLADLPDHARPRVVGIVRDVTDEVSVDRLVTEIIYPLPLGVFKKKWVKSMNRFEYVDCNESFAAQNNFGSSAFVKGKTDSDLFESEVAEEYRKQDLEIVKTRRPSLHLRDPAKRARETSRIRETNKIPMLDSHGEVVGVLGIVIDLTERSRVYERAAKAHVHVLLGAIWALDLQFDSLKTKIDDPSLFDGCEAVLNRMRERVNRSRAYLSSTHSTAPIVFDVRELIGKMQLEFGGDIRLKIALPDEPLRVCVSYMELEICVTELLTNAFRVINAEGRVSLSAERVENRCVIRVDDDGPGLGAIEPNKEFFFNSERDQPGFGLIQVADSVQSMRGLFFQTPGPSRKGAHFVIDLPAEDDNPEYG